MGFGAQQVLGDAVVDAEVQRDVLFAHADARRRLKVGPAQEVSEVLVLLQAASKFELVGMIAGRVHRHVDTVQCNQQQRQKSREQHALIESRMEYGPQRERAPQRQPSAAQQERMARERAIAISSQWTNAQPNQMQRAHRNPGFAHPG
ncbi:MAG: hypothetical protein NTX13_00565 [Acidobacteria bacterium]|nr:hypothetical protein [Acidobacteriota bacterium]